MDRNACPNDSGAMICPLCGSPMIRVTSHDQCPQCGFILPCCDGDAVIEMPSQIDSILSPTLAQGSDTDTPPKHP